MTTLARLTKGQKDSIQINKIRNEKGDITRNWGNSKNHQILLQMPILNTTGESGGNGQFSRNIKSTAKLNQDQIDHLNSPITPEEI